MNAAQNISTTIKQGRQTPARRTMAPTPAHIKNKNQIICNPLPQQSYGYPLLLHSDCRRQILKLIRETQIETELTCCLDFFVAPSTQQHPLLSDSNRLIVFFVDLPPLRPESCWCWWASVSSCQLPTDPHGFSFLPPKAENSYSTAAFTKLQHFRLASGTSSPIGSV